MPGASTIAQWTAGLGEWTVASAPPDADLATLVVEYWEVEGRLAPFREKILPNGCIEVMFNLGPRHETITEHGRETWDHSWFSGLQERALDIESKEGTHLVSARLNPVAAWMLFGADGVRAANRVVDLETLIGAAAASLRRTLQSANNPSDRFAVLENFIRSRTALVNAVQQAVIAAARAIDEAHGNLRISSLHEKLDVSRKHLSVQFTRQIGISPKAYAQVRRFVWTVACLRGSETVQWAALAEAAGYSDQSHLIRDFQRVSAANPTAYLRTRSPDNTALLEEPTA
jgi:AraC-like DNA-binding protein